MTQTNNSYDKLYENMRQRFTVSCDNTEYTLGEYMLMKADSKKSDDAALPVAVMTAVSKSEMAVSGIVSFVDDKLTIKQPPVKDKTIRSFPFRASASAFLLGFRRGIIGIVAGLLLAIIINTVKQNKKSCFPMIPYFTAAFIPAYFL